MFGGVTKTVYVRIFHHGHTWLETASSFSNCYWTLQLHNYIKYESIPKNRNGILGCGEFEKGVPRRMGMDKDPRKDLETSKMLNEGWSGKHLYKIRSEDLKLLTKDWQI